MCMSKVFGHRKCKSEVEVVAKSDFDAHAHGVITRGGKVKGVTKPMLLITDAAGNIVAARAITADLIINGTLTADKVVGAVYM